MWNSWCCNKSMLNQCRRLKTEAWQDQGHRCGRWWVLFRGEATAAFFLGEQFNFLLGKQNLVSNFFFFSTERANFVILQGWWRRAAVTGSLTVSCVHISVFHIIQCCPLICASALWSHIPCTGTVISQVCLQAPHSAVHQVTLARILCFQHVVYEWGGNQAFWLLV